MNSRLALCFILICSLFLLGCSDDSTPTEIADDDNGDDNTHKHLALDITCIDGYDNTTGAIVEVAIYNQSTQTRMVLGSSLPTGYFCTINPFDCSIPYRVEIYTIDTSECIMAVWDISYANNPDWWVENFGDPAEASCHIGSCSNPATSSGCWGN